jgi:succinoglycan biosynthesis transport protein ExoP
MVLQDYYRIFMKYLRAGIVGGTIVSVVILAADLYTKYIPPFQSTSAVLIGGDVGTVAANTEYVTIEKQYTATFADYASRQPILQAVIDNLHLHTTPKSLSSYVSGSQVQGTQIVDITATDMSPKMAAAIANEVATQLVLQTPRSVHNFTTIVDRGTVPIIPSFTFLLIPILAWILGFLLVAGYGFVIEFLRDPVFSAEELSKRTGLPVLATVRSRRKPRSWGERMRRRRLPNWRKVNQTPWWPLVQTSLRHISELALPTNPHPKRPLVLVTSANAADRQAKAMAAANLAAAWAKTGAKVLLVEADLASPLLAKWFKLPKGPGLADLLEKMPPPEEVKDMLCPTMISGLCVLPAGQDKEDIYENLSDQTLTDVLAALSEYVEAVVVDGPAVLDDREAAVIAKAAQGVFLAVKSGQTSLSAVSDARDALVMAQNNLWGAILVDGAQA